MLISGSSFFSLFPFGNRKFVFYVCESTSVWQIVFLDFTYKAYHRVCVFTSLNVIIWRRKAGEEDQ